MKVRSNILTRGDVVNAVLAVPGVNFIDVGNVEGWYVPVREFSPRSYARGFEFFLTGSSKYNAAHQGGQGGYEKAATWDEWGVVMAALYAIDPDAEIGFYSSRSDFIAKTRAEHERIATWHDADGYQAQCHQAPWLEEALV